MSKTAETEDQVALRNLLHKLNNDLSLILGYIDLAARAAKDGPETITSRLQSAKDSARRMAASIVEAQKAAREGKFHALP